MTNLESFSQDLIEAHLKGTRICPSISKMSRADILWVQSNVSAALGAVLGFKVGRVIDEPPIIAPIPAIYLTENKATRIVQGRLGIELEVGFEVIKALPANGLFERPQDYLRPRVVFELVDTRLSSECADDPGLKFADFQVNAGIVIGDGPQDWDGTDFGDVRARLLNGTKPVFDGKTTVPGGSALANFNLLITHLGNHCGGLQVGQIVITGSICGLPMFEAGSNLSGWVEGLGDVSVSLTSTPEQANETV